jgi:hypothetical protein
MVDRRGQNAGDLHFIEEAGFVRRWINDRAVDTEHGKSRLILSGVVFDRNDAVWQVCTVVEDSLTRARHARHGPQYAAVHFGAALRGASADQESVFTGCHDSPSSR